MLSFIFPTAGSLYLCMRYESTPGKKALRCKIVAAQTGNSIYLSQARIRTVGLLVTTLPLGIGLLWAGLDPKKRGWHDYLAGTWVVHNTLDKPVC